MTPEHDERDERAAAAATWYQLYRARTAVFRVLEQALMPHGLTLPQLQALAVINDDEAVAPAAVARRRGVEYQTMTGVLDSIERHGWIKRVRDLPDRRRVRLVITPPGAAQLERGAATVDAMLQRIFGPIGEADQGVLAGLLQTLRERNPPS
jgi:DNA-binding MarR family transcriptional regulator